MSITVGGKTAGTVTKPSGPTPRDENALAVLDLYHEQVIGWRDELHDLERRRFDLEAALEDPALQDHPKRQAAATRSSEMFFTVEGLVENIGWKLEDVTTYWQRLSPAAVEQAAKQWGTTRGDDVGALWHAIEYKPTALWQARRRRAKR